VELGKKAYEMTMSDNWTPAQLVPSRLPVVPPGRVLNETVSPPTGPKQSRDVGSQEPPAGGLMTGFTTCSMVSFKAGKLNCG
jgi:hypothetical protein